MHNLTFAESVLRQKQPHCYSLFTFFPSILHFINRNLKERHKQLLIHLKDKSIMSRALRSMLCKILHMNDQSGISIGSRKQGQTNLTQTVDWLMQHSEILGTFMDNEPLLSDHLLSCVYNVYCRCVHACVCTCHLCR